SPSLAGHYAIGRDPVILVAGEARVAAMAGEALLHCSRGRKILQHFVAGAVAELALLVGVALGVAPRDRRAAALDVAVVEKRHGGAGLQVRLQRLEEAVQPGERNVRPPEAGKAAAELARPAGQGIGIA